MPGILGLRRLQPAVFRGYVTMSYSFIDKVLFHHSEVQH